MLPMLNLVVIRSLNIEKAVKFYESLGIKFIAHSHGSGPLHYSYENDGMVLEIYPCGELPTEQLTRLGFKVSSIKDAIEKAIAAGGSVVSPPKKGEWGLRAVLSDCDDRRVELLEVEN